MIGFYPSTSTKACWGRSDGAFREDLTFLVDTLRLLNHLDLYGHDVVFRLSHNFERVFMKKFLIEYSDNDMSPRGERFVTKIYLPDEARRVMAALRSMGCHDLKMVPSENKA